MSHLVAVSPHLDDAVFSIGGLLAARARAGDRITIVSCFTGNVERPQGFALACQLDKGLGPEVDYMALRRCEDLAACAMISGHAIHLPFLEAPHRGYADAPALFGPRRSDDDVLAPLTGALGSLLRDLAPDLLLGPLAIGDHVDHWIVRDALAAAKIPVMLWADWPYLRKARLDFDQAPALRHPLTDVDRRTRLQMSAAYSTQVGFQFGGLRSLERQSSEIVEERLYAM